MKEEYYNLIGNNFNQQRFVSELYIVYIYIYVSLCVGGSKEKAGIQIQCIPEKRDTTSEWYAHNCYINL